jgi:hypothetical protein
MPFRARKRITIIPGLVRLNLSGTTGRNGTKGGASWTVGILGFATYSTGDGRYRVNTPGIGWWESSTRAQRRKRRADAAAVRRGPSALGVDPDAGAFAKYFRAVRKEGGDPTAAARAYGRCPDCGRLLPRTRGGAAACSHCLRKAQRSYERAEAAAADEARLRREARAPVKPARKPAPPVVSAPQNAHGQAVPTDGDGWPTGTDRWTAHVDELNQRGAEARERRAQDVRAAGLCGHPTKADRSPCLNHAGSCPHHRAGVLR